MRKRVALGTSFLVLVLVGAAITATISPGRPLGISLALGLGIGGLVLGLFAGRRFPLERLVMPLTVLALVMTALLFSPLGAWNHGALRHVDLGVSIEPSGIWVLSCHVATAAALTGLVSSRWMWLNFAGAATAAVVMPELSLIPQVAAGALVMTWMVGKRLWALLPVGLGAAAIALSLFFPYVQGRWKGFLDPVAHARGAGYDYRGLAEILSGSQLFGSASGALPRVSSPADDYWLAAGMWHWGMVPIVLWALAVVALLILTHRAFRDRRPAGLILSGMSATMGICLAIHAGYNLGLWPITAISAPLVGFGGSLIAAQLMGIGLGLGATAQGDTSST